MRFDELNDLLVGIYAYQLVLIQIWEQCMNGVRIFDGLEALVLERIFAVIMDSPNGLVTLE